MNFTFISLASIKNYDTSEVFAELSQAKSVVDGRIFTWSEINAKIIQQFINFNDAECTNINLHLKHLANRIFV